MKSLKWNKWSYEATIVRWSAILLMAQTMFLLRSRAQTTEKSATPSKEIPDAGITSAVEDGFIFEKGVFWNDVDVATSQGIVTLSGSVDNLLVKKRAVKIAESTRGVRGVIDRTTVTPVSRLDDDVRKDILAALTQDPATDSYQVAASVKDGVVTLTGSLGSYPEKQLAARICEGVKGIKEVHNDVTIKYQAKRTDAEIDADVESRLRWDIWINGDLVSATVKDGKVTLTGTVGSAISKSRASDDAWLNGVTGVDASGLTVEPSAHQDVRRKSKLPERADGEIMGAVVAALRLDPRVSAFSPEVTVEDGVVVLGGAVGNLKAKTAAEQDAKNVVGVWQTDNLLKVRPMGQPTSAGMEQQLKAALRWDPLLDSSRIDVAVINRVAYLSGTVDSNFEKAEGQDVASRIKGVVLVRNHLKIEPEFAITYYDWPNYYYDFPYYNRSPEFASETFEAQSYLSDEQIKKKIEHAFFWSPFLDKGDIAVAVHGGVATLTGTVGTWIGWGEADKDARKSGAADVINRVEIKKGAWSWL